VGLDLVEKLHSTSIIMAGLEQDAFNDFKLKIGYFQDDYIVAGIADYGTHLYTYDIPIKDGRMTNTKIEDVRLKPWRAKIQVNNIVILRKSKMAFGQIYRNSYRLVTVLPPCGKKYRYRNVTILAETSTSFYWFINKNKEIVAWPRYRTERPIAKVYTYDQSRS
jgi:hypothetical protein